MRQAVIVGLWSLAASLSVLTVARAQPPATKESTIARDPTAIEVRFVDRSLLRMSLQHEKIDVQTRFGRLSIPTVEIRKIDFGLRIPAATAKRVEMAIVALGSSEFDQRETASRELISLKELAYPAVVKATTDADAETARRARKIAETIEQSVEKDLLTLKPHDTIVTNDFTVVGSVELAEFNARTPLFGEMPLKIGQLRSIVWTNNITEIEFEFDAALYGATADTWMTTEVALESGMLLEVSAGGQIDLRPHGQVGQHMAGPNGPVGQNLGQGPMVGNRSYPPGTLLGRVGSGPIFVIGDTYKARVTATGKLMLRSAPGPWNNPPAGTFKLRVKPSFD
jgi:hypothetical protein